MPNEPRSLKIGFWLLSLLPAGGTALAFFDSHPQAVEIGCGLWLALTAFMGKVWKELEDEAVKGTAGLCRALPGKIGQIVARSWDWLWLGFTAWGPGATPTATARNCATNSARSTTRGWG